MYEALEPELARLTTLRLGGKAIAMLCPENIDDLASLPERAKALGGSLMPIGRGSNLLCHDGFIPLVLVSLRNFADITILDVQDNAARLKAGAGVPLPRLLRFCHQHGLTGLEGLVGIPGNVGGACAMNAGSFGCEIGKLIESVDFLTSDGIVTMPASNLQFAYRSLTAPFSGKLPIITHITFTLTHSAFNVIFRAMNLNLIDKKSKQPITAWSAGCAFKNPGNGLPSAGKLLENAGFRGKRNGGMAFSAMHANFLINEAKGSATAALDLLHEASEAVKKDCGIDLELEIKVVS